MPQLPAAQGESLRQEIACREINDPYFPSMEHKDENIMKKRLGYFLICLLISGISILKVVQVTAATCGDDICEATEDMLNCFADCKDREWSVVHGHKVMYLKLSSVSDPQWNFINKYFSYIMTSLGNDKLREKVTTRLTLYRSINSYGDEGFSYFDWDHVNGHENMFFHVSERTPENRVTNQFGFLMNGHDLVDEDDDNAENHWANYYAENAAADIERYEYDVLFVDSVTHRLSTFWTNGVDPADILEYNEGTYKDARVQTIRMLKSSLEDKKVIINGLHQGSITYDTLEECDGGMWETFIFQQSTGWKGFDNWLSAIQMTEAYKEDKEIRLVSKKLGILTDIDSRKFILGSYLLVKNANVTLTMTDIELEATLANNKVYIFPEYVLYIGEAKGKYYLDNGLYRRDFDGGFVIVNPADLETYSFTITTDNLYTVEPMGLVNIDTDGVISGGSLHYHQVTPQTIHLEPQSAEIFLYKDTSGIVAPTNLKISS